MPERTDNKSAYLGKLLALTVAYMAAGRLGLLLTLPNGLASPVWLPAGIALACILIWGYRYWPGVFLGSFLVNGIITFDTSSTEAILKCILIDSVVASGVSLQAVAAAAMVRRAVTFPNALEGIKDIGRLLCLGGPIACLISATVGSTILATFGITTWENYGFDWLTWWVGDTIGVLTMTPIILLLHNRGTSVSNSRKVVVVSSLLVVLLTSVGFFIAARKADEKLHQKDFEQRASLIAANFQKYVSHYENILVAIDSFFQSTEYVTYDEFEKFTKQFFLIHPGIQALTWNPGVTHDQRDAFEQSIRDQGFPDFAIKDPTSEGGMARSPRRKQYFPVTYVVPYEGNQIAHGHDPYQLNPETSNLRRKTLNEARDTGTTRSTGRISIIQDQSNRYGLLLYHPIYAKCLENTSIENRRKCLIGYVAGAFLIPEMVAPAMKESHKHGVQLILWDVTSPDDSQLLYDSRTPNHKESREPLPVLRDDLTWSTRFDLAGRTCEAQFIGNPIYYAADKNWGLWAVLAGGFVFTALFGVFILTVTARTDIVQRMVHQQTNELEEHNKALVSEVTDRRRAEEALSASEERFSIAVKGTSDGLWDWFDVTQDAEWWSPRFYELLGYKDGEIEGSLSQFKTMLHPDDLDRTFEAFSKHFEENKPFDIEYRLKTKAGPYRWFHARGKSVRDGSDKPLRMAGSISDITDRKKSQEALRESEQRFRLIADSSPTLIWMSDTDNLSTYFNKTWLDFTGRTMEQELGHEWTKGIHPEDLDRCLGICLGSFEKRSMFEVEYRLRRFDGEYRWVLDVGAPRFAPGGTFAGYTGSCIDITGRKKAEELLRKSESQLEQKHATLEQFLYAASHDLKSPVVTILGYSGHIAKSLKAGRTQELPEFVQRIESAAKRMGDHINGLLEVGRLGWQSDQREVVDINEIVASISVELSPLLTPRGIIFDVQPDMPKIHADRQRIWQLFENLLMNAVKYGSGNDHPRIQVGTEVIQGVPWFYVRDNGDGIAEKYHEKIFGLFHRLNRDKKGTGVGLTIVKRIAETYAGEIRVESIPGQGATFWVSFSSSMFVNELFSA